MGRKQYLAGIDIGTTGAKTILFDLEGNAVAGGYREYPCMYPRPTWVEQDAELLIRAAFETSRAAIWKSGIDPSDILAVGASSQRACALFIDREDRPLLMMSWQDSRTVREVEKIRRQIGDRRFYDITGMANKPMWTVSRLLYVRDRRPDIWEKTCKVVQVQDYLLRRLGAGDYYSDESEAALTGMWDTDHWQWSEELLEKLEIDRTLLSEVRSSGTRIGAVSGQASKESGFAPGTPVCTGLGDQNSACIGAGVVRPGMLSVSLGTGGEAVAFLDRPFRDPDGLTCVSNHGIHGSWQLEGLQNGSAGVFRWYRDQFCEELMRKAEQTGEDIYDLMTAEAALVPAGAEGLLFLPHLAAAAAPRWNTEARGVLLGMTLSHQNSHLIRAFMEGIILEQKDILNSFSRMGISCDRIRIIGGPTKSELWNQIQADIYGIPTETLKVKDAAVLGGAMAAAVGIGLYDGFREAADALVHADCCYEPSAENRNVYEALYELYTDTYRALEGQGIYRRLAELQAGERGETC